MKHDKIFWRKLTKTFNDFVETNNWERSVKISHTGLFPNHSTGRGPNPGEPTLLDFSTRITEARAVHFEMTGVDSIHIYVASKTNSANWTRFDVRKGGKNYQFTLGHRHSGDSERMGGYMVRDIVKAKAEREGCELSDVYFSDGRDLAKELVLQGFSIVSQFDFSESVSFGLPHHGGGTWIKPLYVKQFKTGVEIAWVSSGTYNSLPNVVRIETMKASKKQRQSLSELGLEGSGYYDHHYRCEILPSQAKAAKSFFGKRFKNELKNRKGQRG